jgi:hypothetical protein
VKRCGQSQPNHCRSLFQAQVSLLPICSPKLEHCYVFEIEFGDEFDLKICLDSLLPGLSLGGDLLHQSTYSLVRAILPTHVIPLIDYAVDTLI